MQSYMIVPAILEKNPEEVAQRLIFLKGLTDYVQLDIIENWPEAENTISLKELKKVNQLADFNAEYHLMVKNPITYLKDCVSLGAKVVIGQVEYMESQSRFVKQCHQLGLKAGLALDLPTFLTKLEKQVFYKLDCCLLMAITAGAQGKIFNKAVLGKLKRLVRIKKDLGLDFTISIDGGINMQTIKWCVANGANQLCVGSYLFKANDIKKAWQEISYDQ
jgi:ribulose-phosphate 3-epimerase